jgi:hypothetical protein
MKLEGAEVQFPRGAARKVGAIHKAPHGKEIARFLAPKKLVVLIINEPNASIEFQL